MNDFFFGLQKGAMRSWQNSWAQLRKSGNMYFSKVSLSHSEVSGVEDLIHTMNVRDMIVETAEDYLSKRKNVLRLKSLESSGSQEVLIQTKTQVEMNDWISQIKTCSSIEHPASSCDSSKILLLLLGMGRFNLN